MKRLIAATLLFVYSGLARMFAAFRGTPPEPHGRTSILLTGQFASPRWAAAHLLPMAASGAFSKIWVVAERQQLDCDAIDWIEPGPRLRRIFGKTAARLITFTGCALRFRPDRIAGFHLLFNGMLAILLALLLRRRSLYFCVGGPAEVLDGGIDSENRLFGAFDEGSAAFERRLLRITQYSDAIIFMGTRAREFYEARGYRGRAFVNPGGIEMAETAQVSYADRTIDALFVGRIERIKDIPLLLEAVRAAKKYRPGIRVAIVGEGSERSELESHSRDLGLEANVTFAGYQSNVPEWLGRSRVLVLTSKSEGLSLAVMEATMAGIPVVAPDVGDLGDAVVDGHTGFLVDSRSPGDFAARILDIVADRTTFERLSYSATEHARRFTTAAAAERWDEFAGTRNVGESQQCVE